jgi:hypothetical protein
MLVQKPHLRPYFYEKKPLAGDDAQDLGLRQELDLMAEAILGMLEHAVMLQHDVEGHWQDCWLPYAKERFKMSRELCQFFNKNEHLYAKPLQELFRDVQKDQAVSADA